MYLDFNFLYIHFSCAREIRSWEIKCSLKGLFENCIQKIGLYFLTDSLFGTLIAKNFSNLRSV